MGSTRLLEVREVGGDEGDVRGRQRLLLDGDLLQQPLALLARAAVHDHEVLGGARRQLQRDLSADPVRRPRDPAERA